MFSILFIIVLFYNRYNSSLTSMCLHIEITLHTYISCNRTGCFAIGHACAFTPKAKPVRPLRSSKPIINIMPRHGYIWRTESITMIEITHNFGLLFFALPKRLYYYTGEFRPRQNYLLNRFWPPGKFYRTLEHLELVYVWTKFRSSRINPNLWKH